MVGYTTVCSGLIVSAAGHVVTAGQCLRADDNRNIAIIAAVDELVGQGLIRPGRRDEVVEDATGGADRWKVSDAYTNRSPEPAVQVQLGGGTVAWTPARGPGAGVDATIVDAVSWRKGDVALLKVAGTGLPVAVLAPPGAVLVGQPVLAVGYPFAVPAGGEAMAVTGRGGLIEATDVTGARGPGKRFYRTGAALTAGLTGGPVVDLQGRVIGTASRRVTDGAGFVVPAAVTAEMLAEHGVPNQQGPIDSVYATGLDAFYRGAYTQAIADFDRILVAMPAHHLAAEKRRLATEYRQKYGDQPARPDRARLVAAGVVVLVVIVLAVLLLRQLAAARRSRSPKPEPAGPAALGLDDRTGLIPIPRGDWAGDRTGRAVGRVPVRLRCPACGGAHEAGAAYCPSCGRRLDQEPADAAEPGSGHW